MIDTKKAVLVGCSDPLPRREKEDVRALVPVLTSFGVDTAVSAFLLQDDPASPQVKAAAVNNAFRDPDVDYVFDVSGGDLANAVLPYLDFTAIRASKATFFGFSDLSVVLNAILAKTDRPAVNYQIRNLMYENSFDQRSFFREKLLPGAYGAEDLTPRFLRGEAMRGRVFGGNIRCFLKLAGTPWWPDPDGGILLLESLGGNVYEMTTALEQLRQIGVFQKINGILLGTFTKMEQEKLSPTIEEIVLQMTPADLPVAKTPFVGHYPNARPVTLGRELHFRRS